MKQEIEVITIGEPNPQTLSESEQCAFFETLLKRITELKAQEK